MALQVGIIGCFQTGKSTLINCLLEDRVAISGDGNSTTKQIVKYYHSPTPVFSMRKNGVKKDISIQKYKDGFSDKNVSHYEVGLPIPLLKDVELIDTPGFDAQELDDKMTLDCLPTLDCAIVLIGGDKAGLHDAERSVLHHISQQRKSYVVVYNSQAVSAEDDKWNPCSKDNDFLCKTIEARMKEAGLAGGIKIAGKSVFPVNTAWFWRTIEQRKKQLMLPQNQGEKLLLNSVRNFDYYRQSSIHAMEADSNITPIKDFLAKDGVCFNTIHTFTAIHKQFDLIRHAIDAVWDNKEKTK